MLRSGNFSFGKREKAAGAISGEYGSCSMIFVEFLAKKSFTMIALSDGALSCCNVYEFSFHKSALFRRICSLKQKVQRLSLLNLKDDFQSLFPSLNGSREFTAPDKFDHFHAPKS